MLWSLVFTRSHLQFRSAVTGVVYQIIFKRTLSRAQWFSLLLLTLGCIIKQLKGLDLSKMSEGKPNIFNFNGYLLLVAVQVTTNSCNARGARQTNKPHQFLVQQTDSMFVSCRSVQRVSA